LRALAKDPAQRYRDAEEFIAALQREREALPAPAALVAGPGSADAWGGIASTQAQPLENGPPTGALLLPAADGYDEDRPPEDGPGIQRVLLWGLLAALVVGAIVAAVLLLSSSAGRVAVPNVTGETEQAASARLRKAGLSPAPSLASSATVASGRVISQAPGAGARASSGSRVSIVVSSGPGSAPLPGVEGLTGVEALSRLRAAGFKPARKDEASAKVAQGRVIGTEPSAGTELQVGSPVSVLVSSGPQQVRVPNVSGDSMTGAEAALEGVGLTVGTVSEQVSAGQTPGTVFAQSPKAGASVRAGAKVNLTVAKAPNEVAVPKVVGQSETQASAALGGAGLVPSVVTQTTGEQSNVGVVLKQSPAAGRQARKGSTVTLTVGVLGTETTTTTPTTPTTPTTTTTATPPPPAAGG